MVQAKQPPNAPKRGAGRVVPWVVLVIAVGALALALGMPWWLVLLVTLGIVVTIVFELG